MDNISQDDFRKNLNTTFRADRDAGDGVDLELVECNDSGSTPGQEQFSVVFRGPRHTFLEQMTYELKHDLLGQIPIFLVPVKQDADWFYYEAIFNRFTDNKE